MVKSSRASLWLAGSLILTFTAIYSQSIDYPFVWDDKLFFVDQSNPLSGSIKNVLTTTQDDFLNPGLSAQAKASSARSFRPLLNLSFWVDVNLFKSTLWILRIQNLLWTIGLLILTFFVFRALNVSRALSLFGLGLLALHPILVEPSVWISARGDTMATVFAVASFLCWIRIPQGSRAGFFLFGSVLLYFCAGLAKESYLALPAIFFVFSINKLKPARNLFFMFWFFLALASLFIFRLLFIGVGGSGLDWSSLLYAPAAALQGFYVFLFPTEFGVGRAFEAELNILAASFISVSVLFSAYFRKLAVLAFLPLSVCLLLLPFMPFVVFTHTLPDRYLLGTSVLIVGSVVYVLSRAGLSIYLKRKLPLGIGLALLALGLGMKTHANIQSWSSEKRLFSDAVERFPRSAYAHRYYSRHLRSEGKFELALKHMLLAKQLTPGTFPFEEWLADAYFEARRFKEAAALLEKLYIRRMGGDPLLSFKLGLVRIELRDLQTGCTLLNESAQALPDFKPAQDAFSAFCKPQ